MHDARAKDRKHKLSDFKRSPKRAPDKPLAQPARGIQEYDEIEHMRIDQTRQMSPSAHRKARFGMVWLPCAGRDGRRMIGGPRREMERSDRLATKEETG